MVFDMKFIYLFLVTGILFSFNTHNAFPKPFIVVPDESGVQHVDIKVDSFSFTPDHIVVHSDKPVEIRLRSVTSIITHNFKLVYPEAGMNIDKDVPSGRDRIVKFTPTKTGKFVFYCNKKNFFANHRKKGMEGIIEVIK